MKQTYLRFSDDCSVWSECEAWMNQWTSTTPISTTLWQHNSSHANWKQNNLNTVWTKRQTERQRDVLACFFLVSLLLPVGSGLLYQQADVWRVITHPSLRCCFHLRPTFLPSLISPLRAPGTPSSVSMLLFRGTMLLSRQIFLSFSLFFFFPHRLNEAKRSAGRAGERCDMGANYRHLKCNCANLKIESLAFRPRGIQHFPCKL